MLEFLEFKDHQALLDQWDQLVCQANLELVSLVPLAIQENLERVVYLEEMAVLVQWVYQGQRVSQALQAQEPQGSQGMMVHQA